jgi:cysteine desulfurase
MKRSVYLDNAATTPVRSEVLEAMLPYLSDQTFGNPSSAHGAGRAARGGVETARRQVAAAVGAEHNEVIFTSGGTEADNLAIVGGALAAKAKGKPFRVVVSAIEHKAILAAAHHVEALGGEAIVLPVNADGQLDLAALDEALALGVAVVSIMWVNNEVGVIQPVAHIAERCRAAGAAFHVDAVQAFGKLSCSVQDVPCTMLTLSAHKIGGPKGVGALIVREKDAIQPLIYGGSQQKGLRPGTENVPGIVGLGRAAELAAAELSEGKHVKRLRDDFERGVLAALPDAKIHGVRGPRAPHVSNFSIPGTDSEAMLMHLDLAGIACSAGSACMTGAVEPSHVLTAMGVPREMAVAALRFSFWKTNTADDVDYVVATLPQVTAKVRKLAGALGR